MRQLRFLDDMTVTVLTSNRIRQPHGAGGGQPGQSGLNTVLRQNGNREPLAGNDRAELKSGDAFIMETPGGGGFGVPR